MIYHKIKTKESAKALTFGKSKGHFFNKIFLLQVKTKLSAGKNKTVGRYYSLQFPDEVLFTIVPPTEYYSSTIDPGISSTVTLDNLQLLSVDDCKRQN